MSFTQQIQSIASDVEVIALNKYQINNKEYHVYHKHAWLESSLPLAQFGHNQSQDSQQQKELLETQLCHDLYTKVYCGVSDEHSINKLPRAVERSHFMEALSAANQSSELLDQNWKIYHHDTLGTWASKNGRLRQALPNTYLQANPNVPLAINESIHFLRRKEDRQIQQVFYYVHGEQFLEHDAPQVRLYWNLKPEGAVKLVELLTTVLNQHKIAFNFKCLNHPDLYNRADSAVLYFEKRYFDYVLKILSPHFSSLAAFLNDKHPLFTQHVSKGISFAEDPGNGQSFGMHRCQLMTQALLTAYEIQVRNPQSYEPVELREACIIETLRSKAISIERLHLNPNTNTLPIQLNTHREEAIL